ncbi:MAG: hypothetical protein PW947_16380 [Paraburkholderia sp.]|nr:hypothetical protein [Paraburkholderia sp.]MDE1182027.1 hypothetical protein [Paraburkholderia sp.]
MNIQPSVDANNIISAHLVTEISQIDPSVTYAGMPGFLTRNASSDISMRAGETLAISGLVSADALSDSSGMPFLGRLPIIGQLFRSDSFRSKKSDLVIFVTPLISDPAASPNTDLLSRADRFDQAYRTGYGNPSPLADAPEASTPETRRPIGPTPAIAPTPTRSTATVQTVTPQSPVSKWVPAPTQPQPVRAPVPAPMPAPQQSTPQPKPMPPQTSNPPAGVAEALRMLNTAQHPPAAFATGADATPAAINGKVPAQQVGVLGTGN